MKFGNQLFNIMSRIGKKNIIIPENVEVKIDHREVMIKGPKGELSHEIPWIIDIEMKDKIISLKPKKRTKQSSALWGLTRSLLFNCVEGVTNGFEKQLELVGIGYRASVENDKLILEVGFSDKKEIEIPQGIEISVKKNIITISGINKQQVGAIAAKIRNVRRPEPYKGKGIRYVGEKVRRKEGKKAATT